MKITPTIISFVFIIICGSLKAQHDDTLFVRYDSHNSDSIEYTVDTLFRETSFGPHFLFETAWITNTRNQMRSLGYGLHARRVESECVDKGIESGENKIISIKKTDTSIIAKYKIATNCCYAFLCDMEVIDSNTLNLKYIDYGSICGCTCYHELVFEIGLDFLDDEYEKNYRNVRFLTLNGDLKTKLE